MYKQDISLDSPNTALDKKDISLDFKNTALDKKDIPLNKTGIFTC